MANFFRNIKNIFTQTFSSDDYNTNKSTLIHKISIDINKIEKSINDTLNNSSDLVVKKTTFKNKELLVCYLDTLIDEKKVDESIIKPINTNKNSNITTDKDIITFLSEDIINISVFNLLDDFNKSIDLILEGYALLFIDGYSRCIALESKGYKGRNIEEPKSEAVIKGPREGFTENINTNLGLLRRKIKSSKLNLESYSIGNETKTKIVITYMKGLASNTILSQLRKKLNSIDIDGILESNYIEELIEDNKYSLFPTIGHTEKPDIVAAKLLEGRFAIFCDGTPFVLTLPYLFVEALQSGDDYYTRYYFSSYIRIIRIAAFIVTLTLPGIYVALTCFNIKSIPIELLLSIKNASEGIPFSPFFEALFMIVIFEFLREAAIRMPRTLGQAVSIVGALVLGDAAAKAGFVSNSMLIITALTAITSFIVPNFNQSVALIRIAILIAANIFGLLGVFVSIVILVVHITSLKSVDVPFMYPFAPLDVSGLKDTILRVPFWKMSKRPKFLINENEDIIRFKNGMNK